MLAVFFVLISTMLLFVTIHFLFKGSEIVLDIIIALLLSLCLFFACWQSLFAFLYYKKILNNTQLWRFYETKFTR